MNIFVGNLSFDSTDSDVKKLFEGFGNVVSVVIVMEKDKKAPKSRGFGFVDMPDEQQAIAAIAALNGKEFMGRAINVNPVRPKTEVEREKELKEKQQAKAAAKAKQYHRQEREQEKTWFKPVFNKSSDLTEGGARPLGRPGTYMGGRRTVSYMKRKGLTEMPQETKTRKRSQDNPMRWRKRKDQSKPWQKSPGEDKPWKKAEGGARPWKKTEGEAQPWKKTEGEAKPWHKSKRSIKPWEKPKGEPKPVSKSSEGPQKPWFKLRRKPSRFKK